MTQQIANAERNPDNKSANTNPELGVEIVESEFGRPTPLMAGGSEPPPVQRTVNQLQKLPTQKMRQAAFTSLTRQYGNSYSTLVARELQRIPNNKPKPNTSPIPIIPTAHNLVARAADAESDENIVPPDKINAQIAAELSQVEGVNPQAAREGGGAAIPEVPVAAAPPTNPAAAPAKPVAVVAPKPQLKKHPKPIAVPVKAGKRPMPKLLKPLKHFMSKAGTPAPKAPPPPKIAPKFQEAGKAVASLAKKLGSKAAAKKPVARLIQRSVAGADGLARLFTAGTKQTILTIQSGIGQIQRTPACAEPPAKPTPTPEQHSGFQAIKNKVKQASLNQKDHLPAKAKADEAQAAASGPPNEIKAQAAVGQVEDMGQQKPKGFDKQSFVNALQQAIEAVTPQNQEQADDFKKSGKAGEIKGKVSGIIGEKKKESEKDIKETTAAPPDSSKAKDGPKPVTPMQEEKPGAAPGPVGAEAAMPSPKSGAEVSLQAGKCQVNSAMDEAGVTEEQLKDSNEPEFQGALKDKKAAEVQADTAPQQFRSQEQAVLQQSQTEANANSTQALTEMNASRTGVLSQVGGDKNTTKGADEAARAKVTAEIEKRYTETKDAVTKILDELDGKVNTVFENGEKEARNAFENLVETRMEAYKKQRYDGPGGWVQWGIDKVLGMPSEVNAFYQEGRSLYLKRMTLVIDKVAELVVGELNRAKDRIEQGRKAINEYVAGLSPELQKIGKEAQDNIESKFEQLDQEVDSKQDSLVQSLAQKYVEARTSVDDRINSMKAENKGLVDKAKDAVVGVVQTILKLKDMLLGVLAKAGNVIDKIIKDPIGFLSNLVNAVGTGLRQFMNNIGTHLKKGLMGWLFGALGEAGLQMPENFDLKGILSLVLQVLGLTYGNIRSRAVAIVGEKTIVMIENTVEIFKVLLTEGPAGIWKFIQDKLANLKETILGGIMDFVKDKIIMAGITWIISLLNPASAFIKACKSIYDIIMFFVERGSQIMELVNAILDSMGAIAAGSIGQAANFVENSLAKALPVAISFLASLLGVGGIGQKIKSIIEKVQSPVNKAIDAVVGGVVKTFKKLGVDKLINKAKQTGKKVVDKVKGKVKQGVDKIKGKAKGLFGKDDSEEDITKKKQKDLDKALDKATQLLKNDKNSLDDVRKKLPNLQSKYNLVKIDLVTENETAAGGTYHAQGEIQRARIIKATAKSVTKTGKTPKVGRYGELETAKNQEAHHVPPKGLLGWMVGQAKELMVNAKQWEKDYIAKEQRWILKLGAVSKTTYNPGSSLAAISINKYTHSKKQDKPGKTLVSKDWRVHWGIDTAKQVYHNLKKKGVTTITRLNYDKLDPEDKKGYSDIVKEAGEKPLESPEIGNEAYISTQFFKTELNAALNESKKKFGDGVEKFRDALGSVANSAYLQAREAVIVALQNSTKDGDPKQHPTVIGKLDPLSRSTWEEVPGVKDIGMF